jgi:hypothetical protein
MGLLPAMIEVHFSYAYLSWCAGYLRGIFIFAFLLPVKASQ